MTVKMRVIGVERRTTIFAVTRSQLLTEHARTLTVVMTVAVRSVEYVRINNGYGVRVH